MSIRRYILYIKHGVSIGHQNARTICQKITIIWKFRQNLFNAVILSEEMFFPIYVYKSVSYNLNPYNRNEYSFLLYNIH